MSKLFPPIVLAICLFASPSDATLRPARLKHPAHTTYHFSVYRAETNTTEVLDNDPSQAIAVALPTNVVKSGWACVRWGVVENEHDHLSYAGFACQDNQPELLGFSIKCHTDQVDHQSRSWWLSLPTLNYNAKFTAECETR
jgi:hypothetical protein